MDDLPIAHVVKSAGNKVVARPPGHGRPHGLIQRRQKFAIGGQHRIKYAFGRESFAAFRHIPNPDDVAFVRAGKLVPCHQPAVGGEEPACDAMALVEPAIRNWERLPDLSPGQPDQEELKHVRPLDLVVLLEDGEQVAVRREFDSLHCEMKRARSVTIVGVSTGGPAGAKLAVRSR